MKRMLAVSGAVLIASLVGACNREPTTGGTTTSDAALEARDRKAEQRLTPYFQNDVGARLRNCWNRVSGQGSVALALTYTKSERRWSFEELTVTSSTLPGDQDAIASECVRESVRGTSFSVDPTDIDFETSAPATKFLVHWSFPVPLPAENAVALAKAPGGGAGSPGSCWQCGHDPKTLDGLCVARKSGWPGCIENESGGCVCFGDSCASGGFVAQGGTILMRETKRAR
jgi:hypothetical protein